MLKARVFCFCFYAACLLDANYAQIGYEGKYVTFLAAYPPDYEANTKYFGRWDDFLHFEKLVETSRPNKGAKQGRFTLFDNTSTHVLTATILRLVMEDSGYYSLGVDIPLLPDLITDRKLTVIRDEAQRPTAPAVKVILYSTSSPATITAQNRAKTRAQESYARLVTVLSLVCVCTLLVLCSVVLFKIKKWATTCKLPASASYHTRETSAQDEYVKMNSIVLYSNSPLTPSDKGSAAEDFRRPTNTEAATVATDTCYVGLAQPDLGQIYTKIRPESIYQSID